MKVAVVIDTVIKPEWSGDWCRLCEENSIEYKKFDSYATNFIDRLIRYSPDYILWRSGNGPLVKFKDEAQRKTLDMSGLRVLPSWTTHHVYDHKIRQSYLFNLYKINHPKTRIFYDKPRAIQFIKRAKYPFVVKADSGAGSKSFRFIELLEDAEKIVENIFDKKGKWAGREYESKIFYVQRYIKTPGIFRVCMFKDVIAYGYNMKNKPNTLTASTVGTPKYIDIPKVLLDMTKDINRRMNWDWMFYDIIFDKVKNKHVILEITDTCGAGNSGARKKTYYFKDGNWTSKRESLSPQEIIFNLFILGKTG